MDRSWFGSRDVVDSGSAGAAAPCAATPSATAPRTARAAGAGRADDAGVRVGRRHGAEFHQAG